MSNERGSHQVKCEGRMNSDHTHQLLTKFPGLWAEDKRLVNSASAKILSDGRKTLFDNCTLKLRLSEMDVTLVSGNGKNILVVQEDGGRDEHNLFNSILVQWEEIVD